MKSDSCDAQTLYLKILDEERKGYLSSLKENDDSKVVINSSSDHFDILKKNLQTVETSLELANKRIKNIEILILTAPCYDELQIRELIQIFPAISKIFNQKDGLPLYLSFLTKQVPSASLIELTTLLAHELPVFKNVLEFLKTMYKIFNEGFATPDELDKVFLLFEAFRLNRYLTPWIKYLALTMKNNNMDCSRLLRYCMFNPTAFNYLPVEEYPPIFPPPLSLLAMSYERVGYQYVLSYQKSAQEITSLLSMFGLASFTSKNVRSIIFLANTILHEMEHSSYVQDLFWLAIYFYSSQEKLKKCVDAFFWWGPHGKTVPGIQESVLAIMLSLFDSIITPGFINGVTISKHYIVNHLKTFFANYSKSKTPIISSLYHMYRILNDDPGPNIFDKAKYLIIGPTEIQIDCIAKAMTLMRSLFPDPLAVSLYFPMAFEILRLGTISPLSYSSICSVIANISALAMPLPQMSFYKLWAKIIIRQARSTFHTIQATFVLESLTPLEFIGSIYLINPNELPPEKNKYCVDRLTSYEVPIALRCLLFFITNITDLNSKMAIDYLKNSDKRGFLAWLKISFALSQSNQFLKTLTSEFEKYFIEYIHEHIVEASKKKTTFIVWNYFSKSFDSEQNMEFFNLMAAQNLDEENRKLLAQCVRNCFSMNDNLENLLSAIFGSDKETLKDSKFDFSVYSGLHILIEETNRGYIILDNINT